MKYPQLVHIPGDVEHWLEKQLETYGVSGIICAKYILSLLQQINTTPPMECTSCNINASGKNKCYQGHYGRQSWDTNSLKNLGDVPCPMSMFNQKCDIEKLVDELCVKLEEIQNNGSALFDISTTHCDTRCSLTDTPVIYSGPTMSGNINSISNAGPFSSYYPIWTRGLLHDSESMKDQYKMEDCVSSLFCRNASDNFGLEFIRIKSDELQDEKERNMINFYNLNLASDCSERLNEGNTDVDKLIAKFDANIEGIWKPCYEPENFDGYRYNENLMSTNILSNSVLHSGSGVIWAFGQKEQDSVNVEKLEKLDRDVEDYKSNFSAWVKPSSGFTSSSDYGINAMLNSVNLALSNVQKWSSMDGQNDECNVFLDHEKKESCFATVIPKCDMTGPKHGVHRLIPCDKRKANLEEEDLLTSTRTHFRPICMEEQQSNQTAVYADGTTFAISNELDKVTFTRSDSGVLYLDADSDVENPRKYMEYKGRDINTKIADSSSDLSLMEEFIPKFRVRQSNEKYCQTDDVIEDDQIVPSIKETDHDSDSYESEVDEFFFPGDSELAEKIISKMEDESKPTYRKIKSDCNCNDIYVTDNGEENIVQNVSNIDQFVCSIGTASVPSGDFDPRQEWNNIWDPQNNYDSCECSVIGLPTKDEYFRLREELTLEGEQLLSDLSCLQQLYSNSEWCDDESETVSDNDDGPNDLFCIPGYSGKLKDAKEDINWNGYWFARNSVNSDDNFLLMGRKNQEGNMDSRCNEKCDLPYIPEKTLKEKKRRNSSNQKLCSLIMDDQLRQTQYKISFCDSTVPLFFFDASWVKRDTNNVPKFLKRPLSF